MSKKEAILTSIAYWEIIVTLANIYGSVEKRTTPLRELVYESNCALCEKYLDKTDAYVTTCFNCPIFLKTGKHNCEATPFYDILDGGAPPQLMVVFLKTLLDETDENHGDN